MKAKQEGASTSFPQNKEKLNKDTIYAHPDTVWERTIIDALTVWYKENRRDLPWRGSADPYTIWVSEVMAQQTRLAAMAPYFKRFMARFPYVKILADADIADVLKCWEGLGYYARAHHLHQAARQITKAGGDMPRDYEGLRRLPGVGDYTAGAILNIAYGIPWPAVDGNVLRVFSRLKGNTLDISDASVKKLLADYLRRIIPADDASVFTQSVMELGALVCVPQNPHCGECPLAAVCHAYIHDLRQCLPVKARRKPAKTLNKTVFLLLNEDACVWMRRRIEPLLRGMWEFYNVPGHLSAEEALTHLQAIGFQVYEIYPAGDAAHTFTHQQWIMTGYQCQITRAPESESYRFVGYEEFERIPIPSAMGFYKDIYLKATGIRLP